MCTYAARVYTGVRMHVSARCRLGSVSFRFLIVCVYLSHKQHVTLNS